MRENTVHIAGFRGAHHDAALRESVLPPEVLPPVDSGEADPHPVAEDDEFFQAPDAQSKEEAINKRQAQGASMWSDSQGDY